MILCNQVASKPKGLIAQKRELQRLNKEISTMDQELLDLEAKKQKILERRNQVAMERDGLMEKMGRKELLCRGGTDGLMEKMGRKIAKRKTVKRFGNQVRRLQSNKFEIIFFCGKKLRRDLLSCMLSQLHQSHDYFI
jgi:hypothetical protein